MSNVRQSPSYQLSKTPPKQSNKHVLLKNNTINKSSKKSGKSRNTTNNFNSADNIHIHNHNKPLKVVHISNPMRFKATAAEFRALVQGLTGRDAVVIDDYHHHHHFSGTNQDVVAAEEENDDAHHHHHHHNHHHGCANNNNNNNNNNNSSESSNDDDEKVILHHHHPEEVAEVKLSTCLGTSSLDEMMSFDYYGEFKGDLVVMEDLRAFMGDDHIHY